MNMSKKIDISTSSLISLKAELSRKQEEVTKAKAQAQAKFIHPVTRLKKQTIWTKKNGGVDERNERDFEEQKEDVEIHKTSRAALEAKSKLYDQLSQSASYDDENKFLVDFQQKNVEEQTSKEESQIEDGHISDSDDDEAHHSDEYSAPSDPEEDWVDYVDCLGRTRRCLRKDLAFLKEKDAKLFQSLDYVEDRKGSSANVIVGETIEPELLSTDMRREILRQKWEQQEELLKDKTDIHYQDVLFDEARTHGVGYYSFSQDETERLAQQAALDKQRKETQAQQEVARSARDRRQQQLQARLKAARQRKRARLGLPPEEEEPVTLEAAPEVSESTKKEEEPTSETVKEIEVPRKPPPIRPWDVGKEGVKPFEEMSQEDWVKKKRAERPTEFAPPSMYKLNELSTSSPQSWPETSKPGLFFSTKKAKQTNVQTNVLQGSGQKIQESVPPSMYKLDEPSTSSPQSWPETPKPGLFFSTKKAKQTNVQTNVLQGSGQKILGLIHNEIADVEEDTARDIARKRAEIAPPPTFEYYGHSSKRKRIPSHKMEDIEKSITAGLNYLRQQVEEKEKKREKGLLEIM